MRVRIPPSALKLNTIVMHKSIIDITGQRFGRLVVLGITEEKEKHRSRKWLCQCDCGNTKVVSGSALRSGDTQSCGCLKTEASKNNMRKIAKKYNRRQKPEPVYPVTVNKDQFDDDWMFGEFTQLERLRKMFY